MLLRLDDANSKAVRCDALMQAAVPRLRATALKLGFMLLWLAAAMAKL